MTKYIIVRTVTTLITLLVISFVLYMALSYAMNAKYFHVPADDFWTSSVVNYVDYVRKVITKWDWGENSKGRSITDITEGKIWLSLQINLLAFCVYMFVGIFLGFTSALYKNSLYDRLLQFLMPVFNSLPIFITMYLLVMYVGYYWGIVHYSYLDYPGLEKFLIPILALSIPSSSIIYRNLRAEIIENAESDHMLLAVIKGLTKRQAVLRHTLRNSLVAIVPQIPQVFLYALMGSFFVEIIYHIPGIANQLYYSLISLSPIRTNYVQIELNMVMYILVFYTTISLLLSVISDILMSVLDPRISITK